MFNLISCPWSFPYKLQAGFHRWIIFKTVDTDPITQINPSIMLYESRDNVL